MTSREFSDRLFSRLALARVTVADDVAGQFETYYRLLERWNARVNLTSLRFDGSTEGTFDRLLVEPVVAAPHVPDSPVVWFDLGSGGGSPALPLKILRPRARLVLVESKARKAAFLREAVRALALRNVHVETARFEEIATEVPQTAHVVTMRAVAADEGLAAGRQLLGAGGRFLWFRSARGSVPCPPGFQVLDVAPLTASAAELAVFERLPGPLV